MPDWIKTGDAAVRAQGEQFSSYLSAHFAELGISSGEAASVASCVAAFVQKLEIASDANTRTSVAVTAKDTARDQLIDAMRSVARKLRANGATDAQKTAVGMQLANGTHTRNGAPVTRPVVAIKNVTMTEITVRATDETTPTSRRKPIGTMGLQYFVWVGHEPAAENFERWRFVGISTRSEYVIHLHPEDAGKPVTIVARWCTPTGLTGPNSQPISAGLAVPVAA